MLFNTTDTFIEPINGVYILIFSANEYNFCQTKRRFNEFVVLIRKETNAWLVFTAFIR